MGLVFCGHQKDQLCRSGVATKLFSKREHRLLLFSFTLLTVVYTTIAVYFSHFRAFWSPDSGSRFAMILSWVKYGHLVHIHYASANLDPSAQIHPQSYFLFHGTHSFCAMYLPLFPFLSGLAYRAFGFVGLTLVPQICGLTCILVTYMTARRLNLQSQLLIPLVMGFGTPIFLYSLVFWDHSAIMLITAVAGYLMLRAFQENSFRYAIIAGAVMGFGLWLHELFLAFFVSSWLAAVPLFKLRRCIVSGLPLGFSFIVLLWYIFNWWIYGTASGPHLGANVIQNNSDHPFSLGRILNPTEFGQRAMAQLVGTAIFDASRDLLPYYLAFACLLIIYAFPSWEGGPLLKFTLMLSIVAASVALFLVLKIYTHYSPAGLFQATPLLIPALAVSWYVRRPLTALLLTAIFYAWLSRMCFLFILILLINPMYPGTDWGSRYLLSALPLLVLLATHALEQQYHNVKGRWRSLVIANAVGLIGVSIICQVCGLIWIRRSLAYGRELNARVHAISSPLLVTDADIGARLVFPSTSQLQFLVRSSDDIKLFSKVLRHLQIDELTYVGSPSGEDSVVRALVANKQPFSKSRSQPLFKVNKKREQGDELQLVRFTLKPKGRMQNERN